MITVIIVITVASSKSLMIFYQQLPYAITFKLLGNLSATGLSQLNYDKVIVTGTTVHLSRYSRTEPLIMDSMVGIWAQLRVNMLRLRH